MISTNILSVFILHHHQNRICNKNLCLIQEIMCTSKSAFHKYKKVCDYSPNIAILTNIATPGEVQLMFVHASVENKSLRGSVAAFALAGSLDSPSVVLININITFVTDGNKIYLPITKVILCAAAGNLAGSKKQRDWTPRNTVHLLPFLTEAAILDGGSDTGDLLKIVFRSITERAEEGEEDDGDDNKEDNNERERG